MLNVGRIEEGFVLDHIKAGKAMTIYHDLKLDKLDCCVAIIKNARSNKMGKKDIIKVECSVDMLDLDILGFIDHNITVNVIEDGEIIAKKELSLPRQITNVIKCKNPRCITSVEQQLDHVFILTDPEKRSTAANTVKKNTGEAGINKRTPDALSAFRIMVFPWFVLRSLRAFFVTVQPSGFTVTKACTQAAFPAAWRPQASGSRCKSSVTPRGTVEG